MIRAEKLSKYAEEELRKREQKENDKRKNVMASELLIVASLLTVDLDVKNASTNDSPDPISQMENKHK